MVPLLLIVVSFLTVCAAIYTSLRLLKRPSGPFHTITILVALALVDVYIPSILWVIERIPPSPEWMTDINQTDMLYGLVFYTAFYVLMLAPVAMTNENSNLPARSDIKPGRLELLTPTLMLLSIAALLIQIDSYGGFAAWFLRMSVARWTGELDEDATGGFVAFMLLIPWRVMFSLLVLMGFYFRDTLRPRYPYTYVYPAVAFLLAMTTFFRGSILLLTLGLIFSERARRKYLLIRRTESAPRKLFEKRKLVLTLLLVTGVFVSFGAVRDYFNLEALETSSEVKGIPTLLRQGSGILGISAIVAHYGINAEDRLMGKTYIDMLLLPIPRSIYPTKPEWYGIDDITRGMGWPKSTQSAVTIPGEAFANFGPAGLLLAPLFGILLAGLFKYTFSSRKLYFFLYPGVAMYILFIANWMSFGGVINQALPFLCLFFAHQLISSESCQISASISHADKKPAAAITTCH